MGNMPSARARSDQTVTQTQPASIGPRKKSVIELANVLMITTTFTGAFTLSTYFSLRCPESRTAALLLWTSMLLFSLPLAVLIVYSLLSSFEDNSELDNVTSGAVDMQISFIFFALSLAYLLVTLAFFFYSDSKLLPIGGMVMVGVMIWRHLGVISFIK